jgi:hypothetical protein
MTIDYRDLILKYMFLVGGLEGRSLVDAAAEPNFTPQEIAELKTLDAELFG